MKERYQFKTFPKNSPAIPKRVTRSLPKLVAINIKWMMSKNKTSETAQKLS
jgi:hypothetical protein